MNANKVHNKIIKFAYAQVSFRKFMQMLESSTPSNPIRIRWRTAIMPTHRSQYEFYWIDGPFGVTEAAQDATATKEEEGMINLFSPEINDWRTVTLENISSFQFEGKNYTINF